MKNSLFKIFIIILIFHVVLLLVFMNLKEGGKDFSEKKQESLNSEKEGPILVPEDSDIIEKSKGLSNKNISKNSKIKTVVSKIKRKKLNYSKAVYSKISSIPELSNVKSGILVDTSNGKVLWSKNSKKVVRIASMTKIMTILLVYDALASGVLNLEDNIKVTREASKVKGGGIWLDTRETFKLKDLMKAAFIKSANDAAFLLGQTVGDGNIDNFIKAMNKKAKSLGLNNTKYYNPHGLPERSGHDNVSTCEDLVYLGEELIGNYPQVLKLSSTKIDYVPRKVGKVKKTMLTNTNKLIRISYKGVDGLKTGYTKKAGFCIILTCLRNNKRYIAVLTGCKSSKIRDTIGKKLLDWASKS
jgi:D-alanyl-D-alanine carboxypeptidase (penicillin-binding protein 5/6)